MLANGAKAMTGSQSGMGGFFGGMQNLDKISGAFGNVSDQMPQQTQVQQQQFVQPQANQTVTAPSVSANIAKNSAWEEMMKKLMEAKQQNALGSWLGR